MDKIDYIRIILRKELLRSFGQEILYAKDCQVLSISIQRKTNRQISISTLKRLFGIIHSPYNPSKYTLDTLAVYLNFRSWTELKNISETGASPISDQGYWDRLKGRIQTITDRSLTSMKAKLGDQYTDFQVREFGIQKFEEFLTSEFIATAFIAPGGYGKTTIVAQLTEMFFTGKNARYPNDIACLIDGSILVNITNLNLEIVRLKNIIDFEQRNSFSIFFRNNPEQVKGRFVLIIESLYQIYHQEEKLAQFVENLMDILSAYEDVSWFKLIVSCRPDNWKIFLNLFRKNPHLRKLWYGVNLEDPITDSINIPLLNNDEILNYLKRKHSAKQVEKLKFNHPDITRIFSSPFMLQLFSSNQNPSQIHSDLELLNYFVINKIYAEPYLEEKAAIITTFFKLSNFARDATSVNKADILTSSEYSEAYKELLFNNLFYEYSVQGSYLSVKTFVKFSNDIMLEFFLANKWIEENGLSLDLFRRVYKYYEHNHTLQKNVIKYLIKIAFREGEAEILKDIYSVFAADKCQFDPDAAGHTYQEIISTVGVEMRNNKKLRDLLIPHYARSELGQRFYFESFFDMDSLVLHSGDNMNYYLIYKHNLGAKIYGHFVKFMQYFLACQKEKCADEYHFFNSVHLTKQIGPTLAGYYFGAQIIFQTVFKDKPDRDLLLRIHHHSARLQRNELSSGTEIPQFEYIIIYSLNYGDAFNEIIGLSKLVLENNQFIITSTSWRNQLFLLIFARALLYTGEVDRALALYNQVNIQAVPINRRCYVRLRRDLIRVEFMIFERKEREAKKLLKEIKTTAQLIKQQFFYEKALSLEKKIEFA